jgi:hypothetical protein
MDDEANFAKLYRQARRDFITACERAGADAISRVHPAKGPDGKALFCDSAAFGPRDASRGLLLIAGQDGGVTDILAQGFVLSKGTRLIAVHALDPHARAWGTPGAPADWPRKTLASIAAEDLSRVKTLRVLDMDATEAETALAQTLPKVAIVFQAPSPQEAERVILTAIAAL